MEKRLKDEVHLLEEEKGICDQGVRPAVATTSEVLCDRIGALQQQKTIGQVPKS